MTINLNLVLPKFEGPLDLLLHLLEKNEVDIYDIPISLITEQFIAYITANQAQNIELTSEFIVMAANLLEIKSRMLLPMHDEQALSFDANLEDDPRFELVQRLMEYRIYRDAALNLDENYQLFKGRCFKERSLLTQFKKDDNQDLYKDMDIDILVKALNKVILRIPEYDHTRKDYFQKLRRDNFTVEDKISFLELEFAENNFIEFSDLINEKMPKLEVIVTFLALLEILKTGQYKITQKQNFDNIIIERELDE